MRSRILALAALGLAAAARARPAPEAVRPRPPRVALALSGGGARGIAHVGALRALEEGGIPVDAIAANSMGAIVGGIHATGKDAAGLERIVRSMDWASLSGGRPDRRTLPVARREDRYASTAGVSLGWKEARLPRGLPAEHRVNRFLIEHLAPAGYAAGGDFDRLPVPFRAVAGDLATGDAVVLSMGDLALAVRASMSIPLIFPPVDWRGRKLVDGLIVDNLPIDVARAFGGAVVVAVDVSSPPLEPSEYESALGVATQVSDVLTAAGTATSPALGRRRGALPPEPDRPRLARTGPARRRPDAGGARGGVELMHGRVHEDSLTILMNGPTWSRGTPHRGDDSSGPAQVRSFAPKLALRRE